MQIPSPLKLLILVVALVMPLVVGPWFQYNVQLIVQLILLPTTVNYLSWQISFESESPGNATAEFRSTLTL